MQLFPRQEQFTERSIAALNGRGNTLGVAPTGAGKTVMMSAIVSHYVDQGARGAILQHRDELLSQNQKTFALFNPRATTSFVSAETKDWSGSVAFGMIQTVTLDHNRENIPRLDFLAIDEGHHAASASYRRVIDHVRKANADAKLLLVTATPARGDRKPLSSVVDNVADQINIAELIALGRLVPPRFFVVDVGVTEELNAVPKNMSDFDMTRVEQIMNKDVINQAVVDNWKEKAGDRQTVVFCSTIAHAESVCQTFLDNDVRAVAVDGNMTIAERRARLEAFERGDFQVVVNVAILTEGWDNQTVSCVVLLRLSSFQSTMIQMVGRGLRCVDPEKHPGVFKDDCIVLDFGTSVLIHGEIHQDAATSLNDGRTKACPECSSNMPYSAKECYICGHVFPVEEPVADDPQGEGEGGGEPRGLISNFVMTEIDLLNKSPFRYEHFFDGLASIASAMTAWVCIVLYKGRWHSIGGGQEVGIHYLANAKDRIIALSKADDFMRRHGEKSAAGKNKRWMTEPASEKQLVRLGLNSITGMGVSRYRATCNLTWNFSERTIRRILERGMFQPIHEAA